ncbi:Apl3p [Lachancea thermotolerans CBS 6340]|uniref:AP-2 complex subunit alpha n=1 Tax=Lachancea thermotolerans (strain ATCC 56472 / CBS 6340 / NRRL Y-8284) TaxID=559295 RepID=C5DIR9_LACTC|nr:KLTH0E14674p [Lachancea thermotolerans CBS 6340]CAR23680.1 KLTH0E14674p [Lachancea thermotolerans CBS 6340]
MAVGNGHNGMKGLQLFIADLRGSVQSEDREKRIQSEMVNIRKQFEASESLSGYQRKKYVAKLAYVFIATNTTKLSDVVFGLDQCCELLGSNVYSEKFIAYMTLELLYHHANINDSIGRRATQQVKKDLASTDDDVVCLALNFLGVVGKSHEELTHELIHEVFQVLRSPTSAQILKKKSALAFLALLRNDSSILTQDVRRKHLWIQRIISLLDDSSNYRLMISVLPLIEFIAREVDSQACVKLIPQLSTILQNCIFAENRPADEFHRNQISSGIPDPWIVTKIVSILNFLICSPSSTSGEVTFSNIDQATLGKLRVCVTKVIEIGTRPAVDVIMRTIQNTILFSLINFASKLDPSVDAIASSVNALCSLLSSNETNTRYLTLDCLTKLCSINGKGARDEVRAYHIEQLFQILATERDSSIVRKLVDLLYTLTDVGNVQMIVNELLKYMTGSRQPDHHIRSDIAVKVAILTEKYAHDTNWYVVVTLKLLSLANASFNNDDIWQRLCQIVVNNESLHQLTCRHLVEYLYQPNMSEPLVKAAAFLLGEFAESVASEVSCGDLFNLFTNKYFGVSNLCRAMILTTMMKLYKRDSLIGSALIKFYQLELNSLDVQLQTRSYEYLKIIQLEKIHGVNLSDVLFLPMVPFSAKKNPLLNRLGPSDQSVSELTSFSSSDNTISTVPTPPLSRSHRKPPASNRYEEQTLSANWEEAFRRTLKHKQGVLYTCSFIKVLYRLNTVSSHPELLEVTLTYVNTSDWPITSLLTELVAKKTEDDPPYVLKVISVPASTVAMGERTTHKFEILTRHAYPLNQCPIVNVSFRSNGHFSSLGLKIASSITSTIVSTHTDGRPGVTLPQFVQRWRALGDALGKDGEFHGSAIFAQSNTYNHVKSCVGKLGFEIVEQSMAESTIFAAGIVRTKVDGSSGCLMKIECRDSQVDIICKTTHGGYLSELVAGCVLEALR